MVAAIDRDTNQNKISEDNANHVVNNVGNGNDNGWKRRRRRKRKRKRKRLRK